MIFNDKTVIVTGGSEGVGAAAARKFAEAGANLMLVIAGLRPDAVAPILTGDMLASQTMVDPVPQAMVLTAIVIGLAVTALLVSTAVRLHEKYGTFDVRAMRRLKQ